MKIHLKDKRPKTLSLCGLRNLNCFVFLRVVVVGGCCRSLTSTVRIIGTTSSTWTRK